LKEFLRIWGWSRREGRFGGVLWGARAVWLLFMTQEGALIVASCRDERSKSKSKEGINELIRSFADGLPGFASHQPNVPSRQKPYVADKLVVKAGQSEFLGRE
jgi:hypothetical protein